MEMLKKLLELYFTFFKIGSITFGGGLTMLPILERELIDSRKWITSEELLDYYAIAQSTPGIIAVNVSTFVGHKQAGIPGAIFATLGMISPSIIIITLIAEFIASFDSIPWVKKAMKGINVGIAALLTTTVISLFKKTVKRWWHFILYAAAFVSVSFFHARTIIVILSAVAFGIVYHLINLKKQGDAK